MENRPNPDLIDENQYPNFWEQIESFKKFTKDVGQKAVERHPIFVTSEEVNHRMITCTQCSEFNKEQKRCYKCGCFMEHKIKFKSSKCPDSRW